MPVLPRPASACALPAPASADRCFGAAGDQCGALSGQGFRLAACVANPVLPTRSFCNVSAGSWTHDQCCFNNRTGNFCAGAATALAGEAIKVWAAHAEAAAAGGGAPGELLGVGPDGIRVATADGVLVLTELQRAGGKRLAAAEFLRGFALAPGQVLDAAPSREAG